jgi:transcriptional regulator with XRE-family HTH domain
MVNAHPVTSVVMGPRSAAEETKAVRISFGQWLEEQMKLSGLGKGEIADLVGITDQHLWRIKKGTTGTSRETVTAIAQALNLDLAETLNRAGFGRFSAGPAQHPGAQQLLRHFLGLPEERRTDLLLLAETLWRKHGTTPKTSIIAKPRRRKN